MRRLCLAAASFVMSSLATSTFAANHIATATTPWQGGLVSRGDGSASYCAVESRFDNGLTLSIAQNAAGEIILALLVKGLAVHEGAEWPVRIMFDNIYRTVTAHVMEVTPSGALIAMPYGTATADSPRLAQASTLAISAKKDRADFALSGLKEVLSALSACSAAMR